MNKLSQSIIIPYHRNKSMLLYTTSLLEKIIPSDVEIIVVGNYNLPIKPDQKIEPAKVEHTTMYEEKIYSEV